MKVADVMSADVASCRQKDSLHQAAETMWTKDCGAVPVVDDVGHPVGIVTDRDVCMAACMQGRVLQEIEVSTAMAAPVVSCQPTDTVASAQELMRKHQLRRLLVVDRAGKLAGIVSLADVTQAAERVGSESRRGALAKELLETLGAVTRARSAEPTLVLPSAPPTGAIASAPKTKATKSAKAAKTSATKASASKGPRSATSGKKPTRRKSGRG